MTSIVPSSTRTFIIAGILLALFAQSAFAHTYLSSVYLGGTALAEGDCVRPHPSTAFDSPIPLVTQSDMTCGWLPQAANAANRKCSIAAGSSIGIQWHHNSAASTDDIIDPTHKGPVMVYLAKSDTGAGAVWFKIFEDGYTAADGKWGVDRMLSAGGLTTVTIPSDIAPGNYLLRGEIIALHGAYALNGAQPYVGCVELTISSSGAANPDGIALPGYYSATDAGILVDIYSGINSYVIPGPAVYTAGSSSPSSSGSSSSSSGPISTSAPTKAPSTSTHAPTTAPSTGSVKVQMNSGSNVWWFGVSITGGSETTTKVELVDSGSVSSYVALSTASYGYYFSQSVQLTLPISLRLTSSSGKQIVLSNIITSWSATSLLDTGKAYSTSTAPTTKPAAGATSAPTTAPTMAPTTAPTMAPTTAPTMAPTTAPTMAPSNPSQSVKITQHANADAWWFAVSVSENADEIASVELKDSDSVTSYSFLTSTSWGYYTFETRGKALVAPISVRVTSTSGKSVTGTITAISAGSVVDTRASL